MNPEAIQALAATYRYFDVQLNLSYNCCPYFYVVGYKGPFRHFFRIGEDLCYFNDSSDAWVFVDILRNCRSGQNLSEQLQRMGISCPIPESVKRAGDSHG